MKKIGKNTKLYLIGMIIGGITFGITTVIADTIINSTSVAYKTTTVKAALDELYDIADFKEEVKDMLYPVGSIYISVSSTNPSELFGGTWVSFGMGRTLLGMGRVENNDHFDEGTVAAGDFDVTRVEAMGGEYWHSLSESELPLVTGGLGFHGEGANGTVVSTCSGHFSCSNLRQYRTGGTNTEGSTSRASVSFHFGGNGAHNNIQPYITVYMWKRTS